MGRPKKLRRAQAKAIARGASTGIERSTRAQDIATKERDLARQALLAQQNIGQVKELTKDLREEGQTTARRESEFIQRDKEQDERFSQRDKERTAAEEAAFYRSFGTTKANTQADMAEQGISEDEALDQWIKSTQARELEDRAVKQKQDIEVKKRAERQQKYMKENFKEELPPGNDKLVSAEYARQARVKAEGNFSEDELANFMTESNAHIAELLTFVPVPLSKDEKAKRKTQFKPNSVNVDEKTGVAIFTDEAGKTSLIKPQDMPAAVAAKAEKEIREVEVKEFDKMADSITKRKAAEDKAFNKEHADEIKKGKTEPQNSGKATRKETIKEMRDYARLHNVAPKPFFGEGGYADPSMSDQDQIGDYIATYQLNPHRPDLWDGRDRKEAEPSVLKSAEDYFKKHEGEDLTQANDFIWLLDFFGGDMRSMLMSPMGPLVDKYKVLEG